MYVAVHELIRAALTERRLGSILHPLGPEQNRHYASPFVMARKRPVSARMFGSG
jgi:hypothetical protein